MSKRIEYRMEVRRTGGLWFTEFSISTFSIAKSWFDRRAKRYSKGNSRLLRVDIVEKMKILK